MKPSPKKKDVAPDPDYKDMHPNLTNKYMSPVPADKDVPCNSKYE